MSTAPEEPTRGGVGTRNVRTGSCRSMFEALSPALQRNANAAFQMFLENPDHPSLRRHQLQDTHRGRHRSGSWSVSINLQYRAIYVVDGDTNVWYWIGSHSDYNALTGRK